jgi:hypothetical protein
MSTQNSSTGFSMKNPYTFGIIRNRTNKFFEIRKKQMEELTNSKLDSNLILNDSGKIR